MGIQNRSATVRARIGLVILLVFGLAAVVPGWGQSNTEKKGRSAGGEIASGSGDIGKGAVKGAGSLASGTGKGAVDLVTLHPIDAAASVGKGGVFAGKNVAVGTTKGTGKIVKGVGKGVKHIF